jgi:glycosyltransferase involved in cell wall biosynthesis
LKILRSVFSLDPRDGGVTEAVRSTTVALQALGHNVDIVTLDEMGEPFLADFPARTHAVGKWAKRYGYTPRLHQWIADRGRYYDVGIVEGLWNHASIGGGQGMRKAGLPYIVFPHGMMDPWFRTQYPVKHIAKQLFWWGLQGRVLSDAAAVAFTCEEEKRLARGVFSGPAYREEMVSLGIADVPPTAPKPLAAFPKSPYLLFMSRIHPKKGCDLLIRAFADLARHDADLELVMAGPDQVGWQRDLMNLAHSLGIEDRVHWPGMLQGSEKWAAIQGCEAFILPSHQENFGIVVAEAMACGKAVLTTDKVNIWREVEASGGGLVENDDDAGILRLLRRWHGMTEQERQNMSEKARAGFRNHFHIDAAARDLERLLLATGRKAAP